jgi:hypothetical protein
MCPALLAESIIEVRQIKEAQYITPANWEQRYKKNPSTTTRGFYYRYIYMCGGGVTTRFGQNGQSSDNKDIQNNWEETHGYG